MTNSADGFEAWYQLTVADNELSLEVPRPDDGLRAWLLDLFRSQGAVSRDVVEVAFVLDQLALAERAVIAVLGDLHRTSSFRADVTVHDDGSSIRITVDGAWKAPSMCAAPFDEVAGFVEVASYLQEMVIDNAGPVWPVCRFHGFGLHPQVNVGRAMWWCRPLDHSVDAVGELKA